MMMLTRTLGGASLTFAERASIVNANIAVWCRDMARRNNGLTLCIGQQCLVVNASVSLSLSLSATPFDVIHRP